jgi:hypothetical protein
MIWKGIVKALDEIYLLKVSLPLLYQKKSFSSRMEKIHC